MARGLVVTCAHVIAEREELLPARVRGSVVALGRELRPEPVRDSYVRDRESGLDLVLLRITDRPRTSDVDLRGGGEQRRVGPLAAQVRRGGWARAAAAAP